MPSTGKRSSGCSRRKPRTSSAKAVSAGLNPNSMGGMLHGMPELGPLLASGRDADIFAYGRDLVVRRSRRGRSMEREARIMRYVARHGYPAPRVEDVRANGSELVMERIDGPTMLEVLSKRPWTLRRNAGRLAMLDHRLHEISAPDWLERVFGGGDRVIHLDLHPLNVILSSSGAEADRLDERRLRHWSGGCGPDLAP